MRGALPDDLKRKRQWVHRLSRAMDIVILIPLCIGVVIGGYALWDSRQLTEVADSKNYAIYKPETTNTIGFEELKESNDEVIGWLHIYDTQIDYPVVQATDNEKYLNRNVKGEAQASGSIFLDYRNAKDFTDFNSILYGHHMADHKMFGDIDLFTEETFFNTHSYGSLYFNHHTYGLTILALVRTEASDPVIYQTDIEDSDAYITNLKEKALFLRSFEVELTDHLILLSTCTEEITNGRHVLVAKLEKSATKEPENKEIKSLPTGSKKTTDQPRLLFGIGLGLGISCLIKTVYLIMKRKEKSFMNHKLNRKYLVGIGILGLLNRPLTLKGESMCSATILVEQECTACSIRYALVPMDSAYPMPEHSKENIYSFSMDGEESKSLEPIVFAHAGNYTYRIQAVNTSYHLPRYTVTFQVVNTKDEGLKVTSTQMKNEEGEKVEQIQFTHPNITQIYQPVNTYA